MRQPNPLLKKLGFSDTDRVVIIHTDDIGMCQASVSAYADLWEAGTISSGAIMIPCPWSLEAAEMARTHPTMDLGVHLTLTSEWAKYRWGPISTRDASSGMIDEEGFFYHTSEEAQEHGLPGAVQLEMRAQVERALKAGIEPTHVDTHMGTVAHPKFIPAYVQLAFRYHLPPMMFRWNEADWLALGMDATTASFAAQTMAQLEADGLPLLDHIATLELDRSGSVEERIAYAQEVLGGLQPGLTHFIIHPSKDTPELRAITPDWPRRVFDYEAFMSDAVRKFIQSCGLQVVGYRDIKAVMPHQD